MIYKRFTEKSAEEWRQIYKALQLLEFLVRNGSERVVDYARSHSAVIDMLKHFHFIDANGKDQGINIRNRAKELTVLLSDVDKIRTERKKARSNRTKYSGIGNEEPSYGFGGTGKKFGGFGSDSLEYGGGYSSKVFGDGGGFDGSNYDGPGYDRDDDQYEEYQVGYNDGGEGSGGVGGGYTDEFSRPTSSSPSKSVAPPPPPVKKSVPVADFISFDDEPSVPSAVSAHGGGATGANDDDFDDFQSASPVATIGGASSSVGTKPSFDSSNLADIFAKTTITSSPAANNSFRPSVLSAISSPSSIQPTQSSGFSGFSSTMGGGDASGSTAGIGSHGTKSAAPKEDAFGSLWQSATSKTKKTSTPKPSGSASLAALAQENAQKTMWGSGSQSHSQSQPSASNSQVDDLLSF
jgi:epsin